MRVLGRAVEQAAHLSIISAAKLLHDSAVGLVALGQDGFGASVPPHRFSTELKCCLAVAGLGDITFEDFTLMIDSALEVMRHPVDFQVDRVQVPAPMASDAHRIHFATR